MGGADIIPGVSGGTMALITGIYTRLINGIKGFNLRFLVPLLKGRIKIAKEELLKIDFGLFIPLGIGIVVAFGIGSLIIPYLLDNYPAYIYAFFFGLIFASIKLVYRHANSSKLTDWIAAAVGFLIAFLIVGLDVLKTTPSYLFIFACGMIAIAAMLLPGISGSFTLLMLGQYKFMLEALRDFKIRYIVLFLAGIIISMVICSRILAYLLKRYHAKTMCFLVGLMIGALRLPFENIVYAPNVEWNVLQVILTGLFLVIGIAIVLIIGKGCGYIMVEKGKGVL